MNGCEHGTHTAGIAAGAEAALGFDGVARGAAFIAIQVFSRFQDSRGLTPCATSGLRSPCVQAYTSDLMSGLEDVYDALRGTFDIAAVNVSLGAGQFTSHCDTQPIKPSIDNLRSIGIATVIAPGNSGYTNALSAPACISTAVSVGSTQDGEPGTTVDRISAFSNRASILELLAPAERIMSSVPDALVPGGYIDIGGSSMAAPHVAGARAVLKFVPQVAMEVDAAGVKDPLSNPAT